MGKKKLFVSSEEMVQIIVDGMQDKKAEDITILDLRKVKSAIADYFVICTATSNTHLESIFDSVEEFVGKKTQQYPKTSEHKTNQQWLVLDYFDVVVHVFLEEKRSRYALEDLWGDAKITHLQK